jgi:flagellar hook assembly protein FlgD
MENSLVKIADSLGNVFYTTRSEGGMVTWDGCNAAGQRVKSGVYYVFASHGGDGENTMGVVTKILVVN